MDAKSHPAVCTGHGNELISPHTRTLYPSKSCSNQRRATTDPLPSLLLVPLLRFVPFSPTYLPAHLLLALPSPFVLCQSVQNSLSLENYLHT